MLALKPNAALSVDRLTEGLWGEYAPATATKLVQLYVSQLRKLLDGSELEIVTRARGYELRVTADAVDAVRFQRLVQEADAENGKAGEALALWRGPPLGDVADEPFAAAEIRRLDDLYVRARELAIDAELAAGGHRRVVEELDALVGEHPLRERLHAQRMLALYRSGRQAEALEAYRHARSVLVEEVGVEPGPELRHLHEAILRQDPELDVPERAPTRALPAGGHRRVLSVVAVAAVLAGVAVFALTRWLGPDSLGRIEADTVGLIDPGDGHITAQYPVGHAPGAIAAGGGSVWVANTRDGTVSRIDRAGERVTVTPIAVGGEPTAISFDAGSLWVADGEGGRLVQINSRTNRVADRLPVGNAPRGVAAAYDAVWVASAVDGRVDRIDLARAGEVQQIPVAAGPVAVADGFGSIWVAGEDANAVVRLEPRTGAPLRTVPVGNGPAALASGEGSVWVANREDGTVSQIDPATNIVKNLIPVGGAPAAIAVGDGAVWVADARSGAVLRLDPRTRRVDRRIEVRSEPSALVVADGSVWATARAAPANHRGGTLTFLSAPLEFCRCLDPAGYNGATWSLTSLVYDGLVAYRRTGGTAGTGLVANLATDVPEPTDDGRTYTFQLRAGVRFSDGREVRPEDFRASIARLERIAPGLELGNSFFDGIVGADACSPRRCDLSGGIETDERARTIRIRLRAPDPEFIHKLAQPVAYVVPADSPPRLVPASALPGTGPYRVAAFDPASGGRLVRNPRFRSWSDAARPDGFADEIVVSIAKRKRAVAEVQAGRADVMEVVGSGGEGLPPDRVRTLALAAASRIHGTAVPATSYLFLNVREPPFDDADVRLALNLAIDRRRVVELLGGAVLADRSCQIIPPGLPGYAPTCPYTRSPGAGIWTGPDLTRARRLVAASGTRGARVEVWGFAELGAGVVRYAARVLDTLGYRARARIMPGFRRYYPTVKDPRTHAQVGFYGWIADYLTPASFFEWNFTCRSLRPLSGANNNASRFCDPAVDLGLDRAYDADSDAGWAALDRRVLRRAPAVPLTSVRAVVLVSDRVGNVEQHGQLGPLLDQFWVR
jgi:YVTN family beta-propeller protein